MLQNVFHITVNDVCVILMGRPRVMNGEMTFLRKKKELMH